MQRMLIMKCWWDYGAVSVVVDNGSVGGEKLLTAISEVAS